MLGILVPSTYRCHIIRRRAMLGLHAPFALVCMSIPCNKLPLASKTRLSNGSRQNNPFGGVASHTRLAERLQYIGDGMFAAASGLPAPVTTGTVVCTNTPATKLGPLASKTRLIIPRV